jgi:exoribonuclease R
VRNEEEKTQGKLWTPEGKPSDARRRRPERKVLEVPTKPPFTAFVTVVGLGGGGAGRAIEKDVFAVLGPELMAQAEGHRWSGSNMWIDFKSADALVACLKLTGSRVLEGTLKAEVGKALAKKEGKSRGGGGGGGGGGRGDRDRVKYKEYEEPEKVKEMLEKGLLCQGALRVNPHNRREAYATVKNFAYDVKFTSLTAQNRAFDCDVVAIRINPISAWIKMETATPENASAAAEKAEESDDDSLTGEDDDEEIAQVAAVVESAPLIPLTELQELQRKAAAENLRPTGVVVAVLEEHHPTTYVGWLRGTNDDDELTKDSKYAFFMPFSKKMHRILVPLERLKLSWRSAEKYAKNLYSCDLKSWDIKASCPFGTLVKDYGEGGNLEVEKTILMEANNIDFDDTFSVACNACLPPKDYCITADEVARRRDLRTTLICSIDPATARDLDDALSIQRLGNGNWEVGVHIADVTHFLKERTALDDEARSRCTSVYLVDQCIPMLPRILSERLCSLNSGQDSLAFSAIFELTSAGELVSEWFGKSVIRNVMQMSYELAQAIIDGTATDEQFKVCL